MLVYLSSRNFDKMSAVIDQSVDNKSEALMSGVKESSKSCSPL